MDEADGIVGLPHAFGSLLGNEVASEIEGSHINLVTFFKLLKCLYGYVMEDIFTLHS